MDNPLPLQVLLPEELKAFYIEKGYASSTAQESRCNARLRVRSQATLEFVETPSALRGSISRKPGTLSCVLIKDISRSGIGILHHEQIFPAEHLSIVFQGRLIHALAVRCRRLGERCYDTGAQIISICSMATTAEL
jgi:hypothetical protein